MKIVLGSSGRSAEKEVTCGFASGALSFVDHQNGKRVATIRATPPELIRVAISLLGKQTPDELASHSEFLKLCKIVVKCDEINKLPATSK